VLFWRDIWINGFTVAKIAPLVAMQVPTRIRNRRSAAEVLPRHGWVEDIQDTLTVEGCVQCAKLWATLSNLDIDDKFIWLGSESGIYSTKAAYKTLYQGRTRFPMATLIWRSFAPLKCTIFGWLAVQYKLWTSDRRQRHMLQDQTDDCFTT
jgi:glutaredoxin